MVIITSDTMDDYNRYAVWAWDVNDNTYLIKDGEVQYIELDDVKRKQVNDELKADGKPPTETLEDLLNREWLVGKEGVGIKATFLLIDQGGHRADEVKHFARMHKNVIMQKGTSMTSMNWKLSENHERLILSNEKYYKSSTIYYLYSQKNRQENFLWLNPDTTDEAIAELRDMRPDESSKWGSSPENWQPKTGVDHLFDCAKYFYLAKDFALQSLQKSRYRFAKAPSILRRFEKQRKQEEAKQQTETRKSWFSL